MPLTIWPPGVDGHVVMPSVSSGHVAAKKGVRMGGKGREMEKLQKEVIQDKIVEKRRG